MSDPKDGSHCTVAEFEKIQQMRLIQNLVKSSQLDLLNWFMKLCGSGQTTGMIRKIVHNKYVEISGEGERA